MSRRISASMVLGVMRHSLLIHVRTRGEGVRFYNLCCMPQSRLPWRSHAQPPNMDFSERPRVWLRLD